MTHDPGNAPRFEVGIDLGTTYTAIARHGTLLTPSPGGPLPTLLPSVVAHLPDGREEVGWGARERRAVDPAHTLAGSKRLMGARWHSPRARRYQERCAQTLVERDGMACFESRRGVFSPSEVAARVLRRALQPTGLAPERIDAVLTVPVTFGEDERSATIEAAERAGIGSARLISEPVATAIAYLSRSSLRYAGVYDLGGGTFDFAVVDCLRDPFGVVAHGGDAYLGGEDVDRELALLVAERLRSARGRGLTTGPAVMARLTEACEAAKLALHDADEAWIDLFAIDPEGPWAAGTRVAITRPELVRVAMEVVRRTLATCTGVLEEAGLEPSQLDAVFLAGGSVALPGVTDGVTAHFGKRPRHDLDPVEVVARGASLAAARPGLAGLLESPAPPRVSAPRPPS